MGDSGLFIAQRAKPVEIVGVACGDGAGNKGGETGPDTLRSGGLVSRLQRRRPSTAWHEIIRPDDDDPLLAVHGVCQRVAQKVRAIVLHGGLPVVVGGDHSCAIGTWKGVASALRPGGPLGLIWIDAHMDAHTPQTSPSGALHGMPLACLLGHGEARLTALGGGLSLLPQHVCLIGVRSYEAGEAALLQRLGVRIYFMHEVARRGLKAVLREAVADVTTGTVGFGITIDLDALDPLDVPGVNTPVDGGIGAAEMMAALAHVNAHPALAAIEIAEYNPERDEGNSAAGVVEQLLEAMLAGPQQTVGAPTLIEFENRYGAHNYDPLPARLQAHPLRRRRRTRTRDHPAHGSVSGRADPGRSRHHRAAARLSRRLRGHLPPP